MTEAIDVCAAVIRRGRQFLLATRPPGSRMAGSWEFPGGKVAQAETLDECIRRELREELGLEVLASAYIDTVEMRGQSPAVRLHFLACAIADEAQPVCHEGQKAGWFTPDEFATLDLLPADRTFLDRHGHELADAGDAV